MTSRPFSRESFMSFFPTGVFFLRAENAVGGLDFAVLCLYGARVAKTITWR
jgi:hypothetical protein